MSAETDVCDCCGVQTSHGELLCAACVAARQPTPEGREYLLVSDRDSKVLKSGAYAELKLLANLIRRGGGEVTIFKSTKG